MKPPLYRKIDGHWYVLKRHAAEQMENAMAMAQANVVHQMVNRKTISIVSEFMLVADQLVVT